MNSTNSAAFRRLLTAIHHKDSTSARQILSSASIDDDANGGSDALATAADAQGQTASFAAVQAGLIDILSLLIEKGANLSVKSIDGRSLLHCAAECGQLECSLLLLEHGAPIDESQQKNLKTALHLAAQHNHIDIIKLLLRYGASTSLRDEASKSALHVAAQNGHFEAARVLISAGSDASLIDSDGKNAIDWLPSLESVWQQHCELAQQQALMSAELRDTQAKLSELKAKEDKILLQKRQQRSNTSFRKQRLSFDTWIQQAELPCPVGDLLQRIQSFHETLKYCEPSYQLINDHINAYIVPLISQNTAVRDCIEDHLIRSVYRHVFAQDKDDLMHDYEITARLTALRALTPAALDLDVRVSEDLDFKLAVEDLKSINDANTPRDKLDCIQDCCKSLLLVLSRVKKVVANADDLLPALSFALLQANLPLLYSNVKFIEEWIDLTHYEDQEQVYFFTMFQSAVVFWLQADHTTLAGVEQQQIESLLERLPSKIRSSTSKHLPPIPQSLLQAAEQKPKGGGNKAMKKALVGLGVVSAGVLFGPTGLIGAAGAAGIAAVVKQQKKKKAGNN